MSAVGDIMSLGYYASPPLPFTYCNIQATLIQYSEMASFIWSLIIACYLYTSAVKNWPNSKTKSLLPLFLVLGFAIPLIPVIVIQVEKAIGNSTNGPDITWYEKWQHNTRPRHIQSEPPNLSKPIQTHNFANST